MNETTFTEEHLFTVETLASNPEVEEVVREFGLVDYRERTRPRSAPGLIDRSGKLTGLYSKKHPNIGAKAEIHALSRVSSPSRRTAPRTSRRFLCELAKQGVAILMISSDLSEILAMSDRILVPLAKSSLRPKPKSLKAGGVQPIQVGN